MCAREGVGERAKQQGTVTNGIEVTCHAQVIQVQQGGQPGIEEPGCVVGLGLRSTRATVLQTSGQQLRVEEQFAIALPDPREEGARRRPAHWAAEPCTCRP